MLQEFSFSHCATLLKLLTHHWGVNELNTTWLPMPPSCLELWHLMLQHVFHLLPNILHTKPQPQIPVTRCGAKQTRNVTGNISELPSSLWYKMHFSRQLYCWSLRCSWKLPVGAAPTTSSFSTEHLASTYWTKTTTCRDEKCLSFGIWHVLY